MSWTWPGSARGDPEREAVGADDGLDVAAGPVVLAGVPRGDGLALHAGDLLAWAVGADQLAVRDQEGGALLPGPLQRLVQVRGAGGEHLGALVRVPVRGRAGDAVVTAGLPGPGPVAEPPQNHDRLLAAGQRPAPGRGAPPAPLQDQQPGHEAKGFHGHFRPCPACSRVSATTRRPG